MTMYGQVTDPSGAAVADAQVSVTNTDTNITRTVRTNAEGEYRIDLLPVGKYKVETAKTGFKKLLRAGIVLEVNVPARVDGVMHLGGTTETVTVMGSTPLVNTDSAEIGRTIQPEEIENVPLVKRNAYQLLELTPGVQNSSFNPGQPNPVITLGYPEQRTFTNGGVDGGAGSVSYYLDGGINMTELRNTGNILPNPDAIHEYRVETNNYDAQYGKMSSGVITVLTKWGTNNFHGSLFEYWRNSALNANNWSSTLATPPLRGNQFGGTFGGPIIRGKTFAFVSYQGLRQLSSFLFTGATVPTAAERTGNFAGVVQWPYSYQLNFSVQRQVTSSFAVSAAYVGTLSHDLPFAPDINAPATGALVPSCATSASGNITARRPIDNSGVATCASPGSPFGTLFLAQSNQTASYNGLQTTAQLRMTRGLMLYGLYRFSHTSDSVQLDNNTLQGGAEDMTNLRLERGPADFDLHHQFAAAVVWQLRYYNGENSVERAFLNGWALSSIVSIHSGLPFTILNGKDANLTGNSSTERAELVPGQDPVLSYRDAAEWFNTAAFSRNPSALVNGVAIDGDSGRNMLRGPTFKDVDLAISRDFRLSRIRERMSLQLRADAYNAFNLVSLNPPTGNGATVASSTFGEITSASAMRQLQIGVRFTF
ncbi:MAG: carboxypeptidase-like regulatory domain-containing protein [Candidatus Sulfotelmatobacter sp.]